MKDLFKVEKIDHVTRISNFTNMKMILSFKPEGRKYKINHFLYYGPPGKTNPRPDRRTLPTPRQQSGRSLRNAARYNHKDGEV